MLSNRYRGYLNKDIGEEMQNLAQEHINDGKRMFLINLKASNIVNSIGASIMIELIEQLQEIDGQLAFCDLAPIIEKTLKLWDSGTVRCIPQEEAVPISVIANGFTN